MNVWRLKHIYGARLALAGALAGTCALIASPALVLAAPKFFNCTPIEVSVYPGQRVVVQCNPGDNVPGVGSFNFFALSAGDPDASRIVSLAATAVAAGRPTLGITTIRMTRVACRTVATMPTVG
jgi:hypothetical protein